MQTTEVLFYLVKLLRPNSQKEHETLKRQISDESIPWHDVITLANNELLIPALYHTLKEKGLFDLIKDEQLKAYLYEVFFY